VLFRKANLAALLFVAGTFFILLNSVLSSQALNNQVAVMLSNNRGLISDQLMAVIKLMALKSENKILRSENEIIRQRLESVQQSNVGRREDKPAAVVAAVTPSRRSTPVTTNKVAVVSALKAIACQEFIDEAKSGTYRGRQVIDPNLKKGRFTRQTTTEHPFWISLHNKEFDKTRWYIYENGSYYERSLGKIWTDVLREASPGSRVLDVGYVTFLQLLSVLCFIMCCGFVVWPTPSRAELFLHWFCDFEEYE
jgi:hypothetical protein